MNQGMEGFSAPVLLQTPPYNTTITSATALTSMPSFCSIAMPGAGQAVTLPSALGMSVMTAPSIFRNTGTTTALLRDATGILLAVIPVRGQVLVMLTANASAGGTWAIGNASEFAFLANASMGTASVVQAVASSVWCQMLQLTGTTFLMAYNAAGVLYACVCTLSGTTIMPGTPLTITASANQSASYFGLSVFSATQAMILYEVSGSAYYGAVLTISGATVTSGGAQTLSTSLVSNANGQAVCWINATQAIYFNDGEVGSSGNPVAVLTVSGPTVTVNTAYTLSPTDNYGSSGFGAALQALTSSSALIVYECASGTAISVLSVAGTVISQGAAAIVGATVSSYNLPQIVPLSATTYLVVIGTAIYFVTVSGTTVAAVLAGTSPAAIPFTVVMLNANAGYIYTSTSAQAFTISGTTITFGLSVTLSTGFSAGSYVTACPTGNGAATLMLAVGGSTNAIVAEPVK